MDAKGGPDLDGWSWVLGESCGRCGRLRSTGLGSRGELRGVGPEEPGGARRFRAPIVASAKVIAAGRLSGTGRWQVLGVGRRGSRLGRGWVRYGRGPGEKGCARSGSLGRTQETRSLHPLSPGSAVWGQVRDENPHSLFGVAVCKEGTDRWMQMRSHL